MVTALAALGGALAGAALARAAWTLGSSDDLGDWRGRGRRFRVWVLLGVVLVSAVSAGAAAALAPTIPFAVCAVAFAAVAPGLAVVDLAARRLPFLYTGAAAAVAVLALSFTADLARSLVTALAVAAVMIVLALLSNGGAGGGDVALAALAALTLTGAAGWWLAVCAVAFAMLLTGLAGAAARLLHGGSRLPPYGPSLLLTWWIIYIMSI
ncbi:hypothetical protein [Glycomyces sp. MUSA5-2]|uniref:hypothetical protein n=1 Tax=Glycomyces sp. MUSA5-2 TaxID=2053002 RepID=UPI0030083BE2